MSLEKKLASAPEISLGQKIALAGLISSIFIHGVQADVSQTAIATTILPPIKSESIRASSSETILNLRNIVTTPDGQVFGLLDNPLPPYQSNSSLYRGRPDPKGILAFSNLGTVPLERVDNLVISADAQTIAVFGSKVGYSGDRTFRIMRTFISKDNWQTFQTLPKATSLPEFEYNIAARPTSDGKYIFLLNQIYDPDLYTLGYRVFNLLQPKIIEPLTLKKEADDYLPHSGSIPTLSSSGDFYKEYTYGISTKTELRNSYGVINYHPDLGFVEAKIIPVPGLEGETLDFGARMGEDHLLLISRGTELIPDSLVEVVAETGKFIRRIRTASTFQTPNYTSRIEKVIFDEINQTTYLLIHGRREGPIYIEENFYIEYFKNNQTEDEKTPEGPHFKLTKEGNIYYELTPPTDFILYNKGRQRFALLTYPWGVYSLELTGGTPQQDYWQKSYVIPEFKSRLFLPIVSTFNPY